MQESHRDTLLLLVMVFAICLAIYSTRRVRPLVDPAIRALGGNPDVAMPRMPEAIAQDTVFSTRFSLDGPDTAALPAYFTPARRLVLSRCDPSGPVAGDGQNLVWLRPGRAGPTGLDALLGEALALRRACTEG